MRVSVVSYLNSLPFLYGLKNSEIAGEIQLSSDIPSVCAQKLADNAIDIGLVPVVCLNEIKNAAIVSDYCIGATGNVDSVVLLSDVTLDKIKTVMLDYQSRTSAELVKILAKRFWKINPIFEDALEGYEKKIKGNTAALVIGDRALQMKGTHKFTYDLAGEWQRYTGLPFVFACWISNKKIGSPFLKDFNTALHSGLSNIKTVAENNSINGLSVKEKINYLSKSISYVLDDEKKKGLKLFLELVNEK